MNIFSLRFRVTAFVMGLVAMIVIVGFAAVGTVVSRRVEQATEQASTSILASLNEKIRTESRYLRVEASLFADRPGTKNLYGAGADRATITDHLKYDVIPRAEVDWALLSDSDMRTLGQSGLKQIESLAGASKDEVALQVVDGEAVIVARAPIRIGEFVQAHIIFGRIVDDASIRSLVTSSEGQAALVYQGKVLAASTPELKSKLFDSESGETLLTDESLRWTKARLGSGLEVISLVSQASVAERFTPIYTALWGLLVIGLVVGFFGARTLAGLVSKPLERLVLASNELEHGHWPQRVATDRRDEIGVLEHSFDSMVHSIRSSRERLLQMVDIDPLTELLNYRSFRRKVEEMIESSASIWIGITDVDAFEAYNQEFGHDAGDQLLIKISESLKASFGEGTCIARYSGNQFAVCAGPESELAFQQVRRTVSEELGVTLSIGLAERADVNHRIDLLLLSAQLAVGQAKASGKNRVRVFDGFGASVVEGDLSFLRQSSYAAVRALAEAVDAKDEYTRGHSQRVAEYARDLAAFCGYDSGFVDLVFVTGTLHDVGKIGVPDAALNKPDKLTDEEFEMIKLHPALGEKIVSQIPELADTIPGIRGHHERYDGRGYPDGLVGEEISLMARILAVADTYDAMTSDRPYRKGLEPAIAYEAILNGRGTQFDPELAGQFVVMISARSQDRAA